MCKLPCGVPELNLTTDTGIRDFGHGTALLSITDFPLLVPHYILAFSTVTYLSFVVTVAAVSQKWTQLTLLYWILIYLHQYWTDPLNQKDGFGVSLLSSNGGGVGLPQKSM